MLHTMSSVHASHRRSNTSKLLQAKPAHIIAKMLHDRSRASFQYTMDLLTIARIFCASSAPARMPGSNPEPPQVAWPC